MSETLNVSRARRLVSGHLGLSRSLGAPHPSALTGRGNKSGKRACQEHSAFHERCHFWARPGSKGPGRQPSLHRLVSTSPQTSFVSMLPVQNRGPQTQEASPSPFSDSAYQSSRPEGVRLRTPFVFWNALGCVFPLCFRAGVPHLAEGGVTSHRHRVKPFPLSRDEERSPWMCKRTCARQHIPSPPGFSVAPSVAVSMWRHEGLDQRNARPVLPALWEFCRAPAGSAEDRMPEAQPEAVTYG